MAGTLVFIHGTGVRDVSGSMAQIRDRAQRLLQWAPEDIVALEWGRAVGPQPLDVTPALPPGYASRGLGEDFADSEAEAARWELLLADPNAELRIVAAGPTSRSSGVTIADDPPEIVVRQRITELTLQADELTAAGVTEAEVAKVRDRLARDPVVTAAAATAGDPEDAELTAALAHAVVAAIIAGHAADADPPAVAIDQAVRDHIVDVVDRSLAAGTRGIIGDLVKKIVSPLATKVAVAKRADFMGPLAGFLRDVAFYIEHGAIIRAWLATEIAKYADSDRVTVLAHSLGGIAAVDLLSDQKAVGGPAPLKVDQLITVGSQAPLLYLMDSLSSLSPREPAKRPFTPWLNVYNREDLLSFCARDVFVNSPQIRDEAVAAGVPFPMSHSAYWSIDHLYDLIRSTLQP
jgi:hypothetical protein